ncbi:MAG TPA: hypothetical protein VKL99_06965 [Candidatus Angelobacter sp.]|nr:hypothetical protein [Candidatus Angelobacter sp.]
MHRQSIMAALLCLTLAGYATAQSNPQNSAGSGQQPSSPTETQPATSATPDQQSKPATDTASKPTAPAGTQVSAPSHAPVNAIKIPSGSKIYVAPMGGFENYVVAGILKKKVPVSIVASRDKADFEINGSAETQKAGWAKIVFMKSDQTNEQASIQVTEIKTGNVVFAYSVNKANSYKGKQSAGEAIGKHLNEAIGKD